MSRFVDYDDFTWFDDQENHARVLGLMHESGLNKYLPKGRTAIDVGAHIGHYTLPLSRRFEKVFAIEPDPEAVRQLRINKELNRLRHVTIVEMVAWDSQATVELTLKPGQSRIGPVEHGSGIILCDAQRLDLLVPAEDVDFIKMDVEGAEAHVLRGAERILSQHPRLLIEMHDELFGAEIAEEVAAVLNWHGYQWTNIPWSEGYGGVERPGSPVPHWWFAEVG